MRLRGARRFQGHGVGLSSNAAAIKTVQVYGGTVAISNGVITAINSALK